MPDANHPLWPIVRLAVMMAALTGVLYVTAAKFDETELKTIVYVFLFAAGVEGVPQVLGRLRQPPRQQD